MIKDYIMTDDEIYDIIKNGGEEGLDFLLTHVCTLDEIKEVIKKRV